MKKIAFPPRTWIMFKINNITCIGITGFTEEETFIVMNENMYMAEVTWKFVSQHNVKKLIFEDLPSEKEIQKLTQYYRIPKLVS